jgi:heptosyltransferase-2
LDSNIKKEQISKPKIYLSHYEKENSAKIIAGIKKNKKDFLVGFHIGSSAKQTWKRYPLEKFIRICEMALEQIPTARIVLLGSNQELGLMREFKQNLVRCDKRFSSKIIIFQGDMRELFELISQLDLVVGNDSGLVHVAAALGRYNLSFFGPTNNKRISPLTKSIHLFVNLPCRPCFNNPSSKYRPDRCPFNYRCLTQISEKKAFDEIRKIAKTLGKYKHL